MMVTIRQRINSLISSGEEFLTISAFLYQFPGAQKFSTEFLDFFELARYIKYTIVKLSDSVHDDSIALKVKAFCQRIYRLEKLPLYAPTNYYNAEMK